MDPDEALRLATQKDFYDEKQTRMFVGGKEKLSYYNPSKS